MSVAVGRPAGLLLAAGAGRRLGRPKALVDFHGEPLVARGVRLLRAGGCDPVVVVVGAQAAEVRATVAPLDVVVVRNDGWRSGMGGSLQAGLTAVRSLGAPAVVVALVDQPLVSPTAIRHVVEAWRAGAPIAVATYNGAPRHPILFAASTWDAAAASALADRGARALLRERPDWVEAVACDAWASARDIDTEADLRELRAAPDPNPPGGEHRAVTKEQQWN